MFFGIAHQFLDQIFQTVTKIQLDPFPFPNWDLFSVHFIRLKCIWIIWTLIKCRAQLKFFHMWNIWMKIKWEAFVEMIIINWYEVFLGLVSICSSQKFSAIHPLLLVPWMILRKGSILNILLGLYLLVPALAYLGAWHMSWAGPCLLPLRTWHTMVNGQKKPEPASID